MATLKVYKKSKIINHRRCMKLFYSLVICTVIFCLIFSEVLLTFGKFIPTSFLSLSVFSLTIDAASDIVEQWLSSTTIDNNLTQSIFQARSYPYYPQFPILIYTQNLSLLQNTSKLILLGNGFFEDPTWGMTASGKSQKDLMTGLSCPYLANYCDITSDKTFFSDADAVVYHARDPIDREEAKKNRHQRQRFVFALWESPAHTDSLKSYNSFYNWTMTYRFTSHIVASYYSNTYLHKSSDYYQFLLRENATRGLPWTFGQLDHQPSDEILAEKKLGTVAALISNQGGSSRRLYYIKYLKRYIDVTVYGKHSVPCPKDVDCVEFIAKNYYFYLSFENSLCQDYTTEKFFRMLHYTIVPVVLGLSNYSYFIPSSGFIDVNNFEGVAPLAQYMREVRQDKEKYLSYFSWKKDYVWNKNTFFTPFCDLCLRLHLDSQPNVIEDIDAWWHENTCQKPRKMKAFSSFHW
ncbi:hypothetical protein I4U23_008594 [Adineta vaga]|nr:hypothetical protein I4U23_008594 [Adineta vaga]